MLTKHAGWTMLSVDFMLSYGYREASIARPALNGTKSLRISQHSWESLCDAPEYSTSSVVECLVE